MKNVFIWEGPYPQALIGNLYFMVGKDRLRGERKFGDCALAMIDYFRLSI